MTRFAKNTRRLFATTLVVTSLSSIGCSVTPEQELKLGLDSHGQFEKESGGIYPDQSVQAYNSSVGMQMARLAARPDMNWQFHVVNAADINAFAVPGGYIYITQGLLFKLQNEAQLAGVLGHEAGHIAGRHSAKQMERSQTVGIFTAGVGVVAEQAGYAAAGQLGSAASQLYLLKYGRDQETEADYLGLEYMTKAGYNPEGMVSVMNLLKSASGGGGGGMAEWTSSHPDPGNRAQYLEAAINQKYASAKAGGKYGQPEFQTAVLSRKPAAVPAPAKAAKLYDTTEQAIAAGVPGITVEMWRTGQVCALLTNRPSTPPALAPAGAAIGASSAAVTLPNKAVPALTLFTTATTRPSIPPTTQPASRPSLHSIIADGCRLCLQRQLEAQNQAALNGGQMPGELMKDIGLNEAVDPTPTRERGMFNGTNP